MQSQKNDPSKIHYNVTRPVVAVTDTNGKGDFNVSPIGFPLRNHDSEEINPTLVQPQFDVSYTDFISGSAKIDVAYTENNINVSLSGLYTTELDVISITRTSTVATVTTLHKHGFIIGSSVSIYGADQLAYNGTYSITGFTDYTFTYTVFSSPISPATGTMYLSHAILNNTIIHVKAQSDTYNNGIYRASTGTWQKLLLDEQIFVPSANTYEYDGTENDNSEGSYVGHTDENGDSLTHFRKGYSHGEVESFLKSKLTTAIEFGRFRGSDRPSSENGGLVNWLLNGRSVNIGGSPVDQQVMIDGFGLGDPDNSGYPERTGGSIDATDYDAVDIERQYVKTQKKTTVWGISNSSSNSKSLPDNKSPMVKDYPFVYNSELDGGAISTGGHTPTSVKENNLIFNIGVVSGGVSTCTSLRPFNYSSLFYNRQNGYHNNITLDVTKNGIVGKHSISIIHNLDTPDLTREFSKGFNTQDINTTSNTIHVDDVSVFNDGDAIVISRIHSADFTSILPSAVESSGPLHENFTYFIYNINVGANTFQLRTANSTPAIDITTIGSFTGVAVEPDVLFIVSKLSNQLPYHAVTNNEIYTQLLNIASITLPSNLSVIKVVNVGTTVRFLYKPRPKNSLITFNVWDDGDTHSINIFPISGNNTYFKLHDYTLVKTTTDLRNDVLANNDLIPLLFNASQTDDRELTELYAYNTLDVYSDTQSTSNIHSKKTFIHLPTPIDLKDGTVTEIDVSLPVLPNTNAFSLDSVGSISGYKNFITQPRAYVLSGYQKTVCVNANGKIDSFSINQGHTLVLFGIVNSSNAYVPHGIHTYIAKSYVNYNTPNSIKVPYNTFGKGDVVKLTGTLPVGLTVNIPYIVYSIESGFIQLALQSNPSVLVTFTESVSETSFTIVNLKSCYISMKSVGIDVLSGDLYCSIYTDTWFMITIPAVLSTTTTPYISKITYVEGTDQIEGLTERSNSSIFGAVSEVSGIDANNISHQQFKPSSITNTDKRVLLATVYPTASNTFAWRVDKDPTLSLLQWNLCNIPNLGDFENTPTPAMVAYERNRTIRNQYPDKFNFDIESNPLTYATDQASEFSYQAINSYLRVKLPSVLGVNDLTEVENSTTGSYEYQARKAHKELIKDFLSGKVRVNSRKDDGVTFESDVVSSGDRSKAYQIGYDTNRGSSVIPASFHDSFIDTSLTEIPNESNENGYRWITKALYNSSDIVNAQNNTIEFNDPYTDTDPNFKSYLGNYFSSDESLSDESNASNRYIPGSLHSPSDPTYPFAVGYSHSFIDFLTKNSEDPVVVNDIRRRFWDSSYVIPQGTLRQMQNAFHMSDITSNEDIISFYGNNWVPFSKVFSSDLYAPDSIAIDSIPHNVSNTATLLTALKSNPVAYKYFNTGDYTNAFTSLNVIDTNSDLEEFMRSYVGGYANNMPTRFYNNYRTIVNASGSASTHSTDINLNEINTESDVDRIYSYSVAQYLLSNGDTPPSVLTGHYLDDNFVMAMVDRGASSTFTDPRDGEVYKKVTIGNQTWMAENFRGNFGTNSAYDNNSSNIPVYGRLYNYASASVLAPAGWHFPTYEEYYELSHAYSYIALKASSTLWTINNGNDTSGFSALPSGYLFRGSSYQGINTVTSLYYYYTPSPSQYGFFNIGEHSADDGQDSTYDDRNYNRRSVRYIKDTVDISDNTIIAEDYNPSWWYFENGNPVSDAPNSKIKTDIIASGMNYLADAEFYRTKMKYSYIRYTMKFIFSRSLGRWMTLDYRQAPATYLTPTIGNEALSYMEKSYEIKDNTSKIRDNILPIWQPFGIESSLLSCTISSNRKIVTVVDTTPFSIGDKLSLVKFDTVNDYQIYDIVSVVTNGSSQYITVDKFISTVFGASCKFTTPVNTKLMGIYGQDYFKTTMTGSLVENTQYLWQNSICDSKVERYLEHTPYFLQEPMSLNKTCYPFLCNQYTYNTDGSLNSNINYTTDDALQWTYRFIALEDPTLSMNFIVPNNVHGGKLLSNTDLFLFQPNTWNVYYHIRPAISCMEGTDIPSPTARTGGVMADATLNSMFSEVNSRYPVYNIPWHENQSMLSWGNGNAT